MRNNKFLYPFVLLALLVTGCGYTTRSALPENFQTIYVESFKNKIDFTSQQRRSVYLPLLEVKVQKAIVSRFQFDGNLRVTKEDTADLKLIGDLVGYERDVLQYTDNDDVQEYRVRILVNLKMTDTQSGEVLWQENNFAGEGTYFVSGPKPGSESTAVSDAELDLARRVVDRTVENW